MKRLFFIGLSIVATALVNTAQAQAPQNFTGFAAGASLGYARNTVDFNRFLSNLESKKSAGVATLDVSYGIPIAPKFAVSLGATYDLNKPNFGSVTYPNGSSTETVSVKLKNHWSLYVAPGYEVMDNVQVYGKLAWHNAKGEYNDTYAGAGSTTHNGYGYGVGVATTLIPHVEARVELQQVRYSREENRFSSGKPQTNSASVYLGYRF